MSPTPSERVLQHCVRSAACDGSSSARLAHTGPSTREHQVGPVQLGSCGYFWVSAKPTAVSAQCRRSARLLTPDVRTHYSIASGTTLHGYAARSAPSSGCVFWHITVCMAPHQRIWQTACSRQQMSSLVVVFVLLIYCFTSCRKCA